MKKCMQIRPMVPQATAGKNAITRSINLFRHVHFTEWFTDGDGITYEPPKSINIAWTQFEYSAIEVEVKICRRDGLSLSDANRVLA